MCYIGSEIDTCGYVLTFFRSPLPIVSQYVKMHSMKILLIRWVTTNCDLSRTGLVVDE